MGLSDDGADSVEQRFEDLCCDLNMDIEAKKESWSNYSRISVNYTLEGDKIHWLACALYVACRTRVVPTIGKGQIVGNCVSLTRLLRSANLSLVQFFSKMKKWSDMCNLPEGFREKVDRLERNFAVSTVIFKKYEPIFLDIFNNPADDPPRQARSRKQKRLPCTVSDVFSFCWTVFVQVKGNFPAISDDLVNSYHLLLCCVDWFYCNALLSNRKDLLNGNFSGLPDNYRSREYKAPSEVPCILQLLCEKHEGLVVEAKGIKEHWFKAYIKKLFDKKVLKGKAENLSGVLELGTFEANSKAINNQYETYVLSVGDFDERIFLGEDANTEIGTPAKSISGPTGEIAERVQAKRNLESDFETKALVPSTPLTGRRYLKEKEDNITPVSTATQSVSRLQSLLSGRKTCPNEKLTEIFEKCTRNPHNDIVQRVEDMGQIFCTTFTQASDDQPAPHADFARKRLQLGQSLYYKVLENIMINEMKMAHGRDKQYDFSSLLEQDMFHRSLFACCLEIVIFSYNSQRAFPWILDVFELNPYHFYKVIELLIRAEDGLSRDVVKHLNLIEETILDSLSWKAGSPLWDAIRAQNPKPSCEDVMLPSQIDKDTNGSTGNNGTHQMLHPALRRVTAQGHQVLIPRKDATQSPTSAADRFSSPAPGSAKRQLFASMGNSKHAKMETPTTPTKVTLTPGGQPMTLKTVVTSNGQQQLVFVPLATQSDPEQQAKPAGNKPKKTGSLALFYRKVYHLASVRLRDLCDRLGVDGDQLSQMWTCFEYCMMEHTDLMEDRHLDQIIMCAIYVMAKVTGHELSFQEIMRCYRLQPQAQSHVYRSVLLNSRRRRGSGDSTSSRTGSDSRASSPAGEDREERDRRRAERLSNIRSSSTLPVPCPNSQPPTPTRLAGTGSSFEFEDRGDVIMFYNKVFVDRIKQFALRFSASNKGERPPPLSPLPMVRAQTASPRRMSKNHSIYISPHKNVPDISRSERLVYCIDRSPYKYLKKINSMVNLGDKGTIKRIGMDEGEEIAKKPRLDSNSHYMEKLKAVQQDRQEASGAR